LRIAAIRERVWLLRNVSGDFAAALDGPLTEIVRPKRAGLHRSVNPFFTNCCATSRMVPPLVEGAAGPPTNLGELGAGRD